MKKNIGIIIGVIILILVIGIASSKSKKSEPKKSKVQQTRKIDRKKQQARNEALRYISEAHRKAAQKDFKGAIQACEQAKRIAPDEPIVMNCKRRINSLAGK